MNARDTLTGVAGELGRAGVDAPDVEAEILVSAVLGLLDAPRLELVRAGDRELSTAQARTLATLILRRISGEPVQYVVRRAWFRDLTLEVGPGVLIPRPETEVLAGEVIAWLAHRTGRAQVLDVGTGSGAIALAVAAECQAARVVGTDVSPDALKIARRNRDRVEASFPGTAGRVALVCADGFGTLRARFEVVVSNPPYVSEANAATLPREVRGHEPAVALFAADRGLSVLERLIREAPHHLSPGGLLALEVGDGQAGTVHERIAALEAYRDARVVKDLAGRERVVLAERV